jgi:uncharacterized protein (DUF1697 family)
MPQYVAFLRGINLGKRRPKMEDLRALFEQLKFTDVSTFIASGNVIFDAKAKDAAKLEQEIQRHLKAALGYEVDTFLRTRAELAGVATYQAFPVAEMTAAGHSAYVTFLREPLAKDAGPKLRSCHTAVDEFHVNGRELYWLCRVRSSDSEVWTSPVIKTVLPKTMTMRNMTTIRKMAALYGVKDA